MRKHERQHLVEEQVTERVGRRMAAARTHPVGRQREVGQAGKLEPVRVFVSTDAQPVLAIRANPRVVPLDWLGGEPVALVDADHR
jgi:hypothetical protein